MVANPDRTATLVALDELVPPLPNEVKQLLKYWTPTGYQAQLLSDWELIVLRLLWARRQSEGGIAPRKVYKPMLKRVNGILSLATTQSITIYNKGNTDGTLQAQGNTLTIEPGENPSWSPPGDNVLCEVTLDGTGTELVVTYLEEIN